MKYWKRMKKREKITQVEESKPKRLSAIQKRFPRIQINEADFPSKISEIQLYNGNGGIYDDESYYFLDVINTQGKTTARYFMLKPLEKTDFSNGQEFSRYYDEINAGVDMGDLFNAVPWQAEKKFWELWEKDLKYGSGIVREVDFSELLEFVQTSCPVSCRNEWYHIPYGFISGARLMYPFELLTKYRSVYENRWREWFENVPDENDYFRFWYYYYQEEVKDFTKFIFDYFGAKESVEKLSQLVPQQFINGFCLCEMDFITQFADIFFSNENIDLFIDSVNESKNFEVLAFLLDYKNKHFGFDQKPLHFDV